MVAIQIFLSLHNFPVVSPVVPLRCVPGEAFATADRPARSEQWSCGGEQFQAPPRWGTTGAIDFPSQIVKSPQVLVVAIFFSWPRPCAIRLPRPNPHKSYLICFAVVAIHVFLILHHFPVVSSRCASPLCLPGEAFATADRPARSEQWSMGASSSKRLPGETQRVP